MIYFGFGFHSRSLIEKIALLSIKTKKWWLDCYRNSASLGWIISEEFKITDTNFCLVAGLTSQKLGSTIWHGFSLGPPMRKCEQRNQRLDAILTEILWIKSSTLLVLHVRLLVCYPMLPLCALPRNLTKVTLVFRLWYILRLYYFWM